MNSTSFPKSQYIAPVLNSTVKVDSIPFRFNSILIVQYFKILSGVTINKFELRPLVCHHKKMNPHFQQILASETIVSLLSKHLQPPLGIDLFHNGGLLMYSFICMIISLSDLV